MGGGRGWGSFITKVEECHRVVLLPRGPPPPKPSPELVRHGSTLSEAGHLQSSSHGPEKDVSITILHHKGSLGTLDLMQLLFNHLHSLFMFSCILSNLLLCILSNLFSCILSNLFLCLLSNLFSCILSNLFSCILSNLFSCILSYMFPYHECSLPTFSLPTFPYPLSLSEAVSGA
jgi:hypothetical protein